MKKPSAGRKPKPRGVSGETLRRLALALPGVEEGTCFSTPAWRVAGKFLARLREDGESLAVKVGFEERVVLMEGDPKTFFVTDHYLNYPTVLVHLSKVRPAVLGELLEKAWRRSAPKRLLAQRDEGGGRRSRP